MLCCDINKDKALRSSDTIVMYMHLETVYAGTLETYWYNCNTEYCTVRLLAGIAGVNCLGGMSGWKRMFDLLQRNTVT